MITFQQFKAQLIVNADDQIVSRIEQIAECHPGMDAETAAWKVYSYFRDKNQLPPATEPGTIWLSASFRPTKYFQGVPTQYAIR